jgi:hypothetical protein
VDADVTGAEPLFRGRQAVASTVELIAASAGLADLAGCVRTDDFRHSAQNVTSAMSLGHEGGSRGPRELAEV